MELLHILQLCFLFGIFLLNVLFVLLPLKLIPSEQQQQATSRSSSWRRMQRILDLFNAFSSGVFLGTCFVHLIPQAEATMDAAFTAGGLPHTYCSALTQLTCMLGFFVVVLVDRCIETCRGSQSRRPVPSATSGPSEADEHELTSVKGYIVTVSSSDSTLSDDESDVELVRERDSMLKNKSQTVSTDRSTGQPSKKKRPRQTVKSKRKTDSVVSSRMASATGSVTIAPRCHSHLVAPADLDDLSLKCIILLLALSLHSLFEGVAIGLQDSVMTVTSLAVGITVHGCLIAFAFGVTLTLRRQSLQTGVIKYGLVYSSMIPIGVGIGMAVGSVRGFVGRLVSALLQSLTAGTFIYVIFMEILPSETDRGRNRLIKVLVMFVGFVIICSLRFIMVMVH
jgi:zinc transporter 1/2/3